MRRFVIRVLGVAVFAIVAVVSPRAGPAHAAVTSEPATQGCPYGAVCVYPDDSWNGGKPSLIFVTYGVHQLTGQLGYKRFFNNQYDDAHAELCTGGNGTGCRDDQPAGTYYDYNFTPINSILLSPDS